MAPIAQTLIHESNGNATVGAMGKTKSGKQLKVRSYPKFENLEDEREYRKQHLAAAYRVFADRGRLKYTPAYEERIRTPCADSATE